MSDKVLVVGFDGATFDIIKPLVADGRLPNLARLLETGASGTLRSNIPPVTPSAWTSVFTGKNPGKHGIYDFEEINYQTYQLRTIRTSNHNEKTIWQILSEVGKRSIVLDVPFTYPPQPLNGLMLTGYGTPRNSEQPITYPENFAEHLPLDLQDQVRIALPDHRFDRSQRFVDEWQKIMDGRAKFLNHLIENELWDFFMVVFSITDNMAHVFWTYIDPAHPNYYREEGEKFREAFLHSYEVCDNLLGQLMERAGTDTTTFVISDHGFGSVRPRQYIFKRLLDGNYIALKGSVGKFSIKSQLIKTAVTTYNRFPFVRERIKGMQPQNLSTLKRTLYNSGIMPSEKNLDVTKTLVIPSSVGLRMWINEQGRFAHGIVSAAEKEPLFNEISAYLLSDIDEATGENIITHVYRGEDLYHGPFSKSAPDLVIELNNFYKPNVATNVSNPHVEGGHTMDGIFLSQGKHIKATQIRDASLIDLTPTILYLLGLPIPPDMDGRVLTEAIRETHLAQYPVQVGSEPARLEQASPITDYSEEEEEEIKEQLRQLGYMD